VTISATSIPSDLLLARVFDREAVSCQVNLRQWQRIPSVRSIGANRMYISLAV
jgi:hypothetical protein